LMSHQWGAMDRSQLTQSKNPTSPTVSVRKPNSCRATPRNFQYKRGRLKRSERCLSLLFLDNLPVVFLNYKTLQNKHNIRTLSRKYKNCT
jgi:hypothetical protein